MKNEYRHRAIKGSTRHSLRSLARHLAKIGTPRYVRGCWAGEPGPWYSVIIRGDRGSLHLRGCSWGYHGEGSHGTEEVLKALAPTAPPALIERLAFHTPNRDVPRQGFREVWRLDLQTYRVTLHTTPRDPDPVALEAALVVGFRWVKSIDPEGRESRSLAPLNSLTARCQEAADPTLPIWQVHELPTIPFNHPQESEATMPH